MKKWNLIIDVSECTNCNNCFIACKDEYVGNAIEGYSAPQPLHGHKWINIVKKERGRYPTMDVVYVPTMCNHCDDAPCIMQGGGAVKKRADGIVLIDPDLARGRKDLVDSCPYGAIWWNEELEVPQAWTFDAHLLDRGWEHPRCVQSCPTGAMKALNVTDEEMRVIVDDEKMQPIRPDLDSKPRVYYKNLDRYDKLFVAGEVLMTLNGIVDCLANAGVKLSSNKTVIGSAKTDAFGEFKIDGLDIGSGNCELEISHAGCQTKKMSVLLQKQSVIIDSVFLENNP